jgi:hypothetical protein
LTTFRVIEHEADYVKKRLSKRMELPPNRQSGLLRLPTSAELAIPMGKALGICSCPREARHAGVLDQTLQQQLAC